MVRLTGLKAFEARWHSLKAKYSISPNESRTLMQSMGRLVDNYATQSEIASELSLPLQTLFNLLVQSYLEGLWIEDTVFSPKTTGSSRSHYASPAGPGATRKLSPAMVAAAQRRQSQTPQATAISEADTYIVRNPLVC